MFDVPTLPQTAHSIPCQCRLNLACTSLRKARPDWGSCCLGGRAVEGASSGSSGFEAVRAYTREAPLEDPRLLGEEEGLSSEGIEGLSLGDTGKLSSSGCYNSLDMN